MFDISLGSTVTFFFLSFFLFSLACDGKSKYLSFSLSIIELELFTEASKLCHMLPKNKF